MTLVGRDSNSQAQCLESRAILEDDQYFNPSAETVKAMLKQTAIRHALCEFSRKFEAAHYTRLTVSLQS